MIRDGFTKTSSARLWGAWLLLAVALAYFGVRGPVRGFESASDFKEIYAPARAILHGDNGYDLEIARDYWMRAGVPQGSKREEVDLGLLYPPSTMVFIAPLAAMPWPAARSSLAVLNTLAVLAIVLGLIHVLRSRSQTPKVLLAAAVFAFAPIHTAIAMGQPVLLAVGLLIWGIVLAMQRRRGWAGLLIGLAAGIKFQLALPVLIYLLLRGRWRLGIIGLVAIAVPTLVTMTVLASHDGWVGDWAHNLGQMRDGGFADPTPANQRGPYKMINLYYPLYLILGHRPAAEWIALGLGAIGALALIIRMNRKRMDHQELLAIAIVACLALIAVYHLFYDAALLVIPVTWAFVAWRTGRRAWAIATLLLCAPFLVPGAAAIGQWARSGRFPPLLFEQTWFQATLLAHQCWLLLLLTATLMVALWRMPDAADEAESSSGHALRATRSP